MTHDHDMKFDTKLIHAGENNDPHGAINVPIYQSSTFRFDNAQQGADLFSGEKDGYIYTRIGNPTTHALEETIATLEGGCGAIATGSGMGAVSTIYFSLLSQGDHMVSTDSVYGPSRMLAENHLSRFGIESTFVNTSKPEEVEKAMRPETKLLFVETPSNPTMVVTDLSAMAEIAHSHGALLAVDNTFASPYLQKPIQFGADVVFHSITKFINGHSDVVGGIIIGKEEETYKRVRKMMVAMGTCMDPHQAYLVLRGVRTLSIRVRQSQESAIKVAEWLEKHPKVEWVRYVGLPSHPQHDLAKKQMTGFGSMIAFELKGGLESGRRVMDNIKLAVLAVSLGGVESLIEHPASMTHASIPAKEREASGITDGLVRYSVGIENVEDILGDLDQALQKA